MAASCRLFCRARTSFSTFYTSNTFKTLPKCTFLGSTVSRLQVQRPLFASVVLQNDEKADIEQNPFYEKYSEKLKIAQDNVSKGIEDHRTFEEKMRIDKRVLQETNRIKDIAWQHQTKQSPSISSQTQSGNSSQYAKTSLDSVLHVDRIEDLTSEEIVQVWKEYHQSKDCISAGIPSDVYQRIRSKAEEYPMFMFPLPRENGYEFMFAEFSNDICLVTSLLQYQTLAENAPWVVAIRHFTELKDSKGIVLMVGEIDTNQLSVVDAQWLGYQIQMYYASDNPHRENLLRTFNRELHNFDHTSVIDQLVEEIASGNITKPQ